MGKILDGYPTWNQHADPRPDGSEDPFAATDCGEECCAIVLFGLLGVVVREDQVRLDIPDHADRGETSAYELSQYLEGKGLLTSMLWATAGALKGRIKGAVDVASPAIVLGNYISPSVLHWLVVVGYGNDHVIYCDPWYGRMDAMHWHPFLALSEGALVLPRTKGSVP